MALLIACKNGQLQEVRHLVEQRGMDVNQPGNLMWEEECYEQVLALPLHTAVIAGHLNVVQYLVEDYKGLTPLHIAVIHLADQVQKDVIRCLVKNGADLSAYDRNGNPCWALTFDVDVTKLLIELGMDIHETTNDWSETIVDVWACSPDPRSIEVMQLLLNKGADFHKRDYEGLTPLMLAAIGANGEPNWPVFEFILTQEEQPFGRPDKIVALELCGAFYINAGDSGFGLTCWRMAMGFRFDVTPVLPKPTTVRSEVASKALDASEVETPEQLEEMAVFDPGSLRVQAILIIYRILGINSYQTWESLTTYALDCWALGDGRRFLNVSMLVLECSQSIEEPLWITTVDTIRRLAMAFHTLRREGCDAEDRELVSFPNVMAVLRCAANELHRSANSHNDYDDGVSCNILLDCVIQLTIVLISLTMTDDESFELKRCLYQLVRLDERSSLNGYNLLLLACSSSSYYFSPQELEMNGSSDIYVGQLPSVEVIRVLLEVGADPDSKDDMGNTGLHVLAIAGETFTSPTVLALFEGGAHLDQANVMRETMADLLLKDSPREANTILVTPLEFPSLKCLSARAFRQQNVCWPFVDLVPSGFYDFILQH
ncbi:protein fem-1 homolog A-B-like [Daphnia carinata]|uniref:protein fem-1 homolog A-B-like n=1 Tax=Daphnia carinata TaxID=120202 RepID=UPI00257D4672|nr:protein fem-1 homolog A-B-like [Daphnia carinata]